MKNFYEWITNRDLQEQGGVAQRTRTIYPPAYSVWNRQNQSDLRRHDPLWQIATDAASAPGSVLQQMLTPKTATSGGNEPQTLIDLKDAIMGGDAKLVDCGGKTCVLLDGIYPDHDTDIPIKEFCSRQDETMQMLANEGFKNPGSQVRKICSKDDYDDNNDDFGYTGHSYSIDESKLAIEIIKRRMIAHEIIPKGYGKLLDMYSPKMGQVRPDDSGDNIEVDILWPIHDDAIEAVKNKMNQKQQPPSQQTQQPQQQTQQPQQQQPTN
jgi:hypothetical protein